MKTFLQLIPINIFFIETFDEKYIRISIFNFLPGGEVILISKGIFSIISNFEDLSFADFNIGNIIL